LWQHLNQVGLPSKKGSSSKTNITLKINDNVCFDTKIISETFNHVYTTLSSKLIEKLPNVNKFGLSAVRKVYSKKGANINNFSFSLVSKIVVHNHLNS